MRRNRRKPRLPLQLRQSHPQASSRFSTPAQALFFPSRVPTILISRLLASRASHGFHERKQLQISPKEKRALIRASGTPVQIHANPHDRKKTKPSANQLSPRIEECRGQQNTAISNTPGKITSPQKEHARCYTWPTVVLRRAPSIGPANDPNCDESKNCPPRNPAV